MNSTVSIGPSIQYAGLTVFPLFRVPDGKVEYQLSDEAIHQGTVTVEEISTVGSVPNLTVENKGDTRVLFLEGEHLIGAKQNRILNTSVLVAANSKITVPVSCVEQGRWRYASRQFHSSVAHSSSRLRHALKSTVTASLRTRREHRSDQGKIWAEVARQQQALEVCSGTTAMSDTLASHVDQIGEFQEKLGYVEEASGLAMAVGGKVVALDLFDQPETCRKVWPRLVSGFALDALEAKPTEHTADVAEVEGLLLLLERAAWQQVPSVGEGEELRAEIEVGHYASKLTFQGRLVHANVVGTG